MHHYVLSQKTQEEIDEIYDFGSHEFGKEKRLNIL